MNGNGAQQGPATFAPTPLTSERSARGGRLTPRERRWLDEMGADELLRLVQQLRQVDRAVERRWLAAARQ